MSWDGGCVGVWEGLCGMVGVWEGLCGRVGVEGLCWKVAVGGTV